VPLSPAESFTVGAGLDLYHPALVIVLAFAGAFIMPKVIIAIEKAGIDDAVGAVGVHGVCGLLGAVLTGIFAAGYPQGADIPPINFVGQLIGALVSVVLLGFIPGYGVSWLLKRFDLLRVLREEEVMGLDIADLGIEGYPEYPTMTLISSIAKGGGGNGMTQASTSSELAMD